MYVYVYTYIYIYIYIEREREREREREIDGKRTHTTSLGVVSASLNGAAPAFIPEPDEAVQGVLSSMVGTFRRVSKPITKLIWREMTWYGWFSMHLPKILACAHVAATGYFLFYLYKRTLVRPTCCRIGITERYLQNLHNFTSLR